VFETLKHSQYQTTPLKRVLVVVVKVAMVVVVVVTVVAVVVALQQRVVGL